MTGPHGVDPSQWATGRLLSTAARLVEHAWDAHLDQWGLNHASFAVVYLLLPGPRSQRELAQAVQVEDQTMSRLLERLERLGHVARTRSAEDRRRVDVSLTAGGHQVLAEASAGGVSETTISDAVGDLGALRAALIALVEHLSARRWAAGD